MTSCGSAPTKSRALIAAGVGKGTRVGVLMTNRPEFLSAVFGTALAGGVAATISTFSTRAELDLPLPDGWLLDVYGDRGRLTASSPTFPTSRDCVLRGGRLGEPMAGIAIPEALLSADGIALDWQAAIQPSFPMALSMQAMVGAIHGEGHTAPDFARALEVEALQEAIRRSSAERRWVQIAEVA